MTKTEAKQRLLQTLHDLPSGAFSTADLIVEYRRAWPDEWQQLEALYGAGGRGAGQHQTVFTHVARVLSKIAKQDDLLKLDYESAPNWWGSPVVRYWAKVGKKHRKENLIPLDEEFREGSVILKQHLAKERARGLAAKKKMVFTKEHGNLFCEKCNIVPSDVYGVQLGNAIIEVHHAATMVARMAENHVTRLEDLQCLCANCHRLVHAEIKYGAKAK